MAANKATRRLLIWQSEEMNCLFDDCGMRFTTAGLKKEALKSAKCGYEIDMKHTWKGGNVYMIKHDNTDKTKQVREYFISEA
jgi:hypothetical protein